MLRFAVRQGLAPGAFWQLSVTEWRALTEGQAAAAAAAGGLDRAGLAVLLSRFPDKKDD